MCCDRPWWKKQISSETHGRGSDFTKLTSLWMFQCIRWIWPKCSTSLAPLASHSPDSETKSKIEGCNLQRLATKKVPWSANEQLGIWWLRPNKLKYSGDLGKLCSKGLHLLWTRSFKQLEAPVFSYEWLLNTFQHHSLPHCSSYVASLIHGSLQRLPTFTY